MSIKSIFFQTALRGLPPANLYKFRFLIDAPSLKTVNIMDLYPLTCLARSAQIPGQTMQVVQVPVRGGNSIEYPVLRTSGGDFTFSCYEAQDGVVRHYTNILMNMGLKNKECFFDATLTQLQGPMNINMPEIKLEGCFVKSRGPVSMASDQATTPMVYDLTIHYNRIIEKYDATDLPVVKLLELTAAYGIARAATFAGALSVLTADPTGLAVKI